MIQTPLGKSVNITKSWDDGDTTYIEGWLSTPDRDREKDIIEPEAFADSMDSYFARRAPLSLNHQMKSLPVGHLQKAAIVRDGKITKSAVHPMDAADFQHFPASGSGVYTRAAINENEARLAVHKGNVGSFSWVGMGTGEKLPDGGTRYTNISPWLESTIAAYPINSSATFQIAKAHGYEQPQIIEEQEIEMDQTQLEAMFSKAIEDAIARMKPATPATPEPVVAQKAVDIDEIMKSLEARIDGMVAEKLQKANELDRGEGEGRRGQQKPEENEVQTAIRKASAGEELTTDEIRNLNHLTVLGLLEGLSN